MTAAIALEFFLDPYPARPLRKPARGRTAPGAMPTLDAFPPEDASAAIPGSTTANASPDAAPDAAPDWPGILRRCLDGDASAWTELVRFEHRRIYALCRRLSGSPNDAEDLTQEVFLKVYRNLSTFDLSRGNFRTWITAIARNRIVDHYRRSRFDRFAGSIPAEGDHEAAHRGREPADLRRSPYDEAVRGELAARVERALSKLRPEWREAVVLRDLEEMDYREIASILDLPEGTVKSRICRGRAELARLLARNETQEM